MNRLKTMRWSTAMRILLGGAALTAVAETWDGGDALRDHWSADTNWAGDLAPANPTANTISFNSADAGATNIVDADRQIGGLTYNASHTTDLGGNTLTVAGSVHVYDNNQNNATAVITNGTLAVGSAAGRGSMTLELTAWDDSSLYLRDVTLRAWLNALSAGTPGNGHQATILDLATSMVICDDATNELRVAGNIDLGAAWPDNRQWLSVYLPNALTTIWATNLYFNYTRVILPGVGSQLRTVTAAKDFRLCGEFGYDSGGGVYRLPDNLAMTVGSEAAPGNFQIGTIQWMPGYLRLGSGSTFAAHLSGLSVGSGGNAAAGSVLDLSAATVIVNGKINEMPLPGDLVVGTGGDGWGGQFLLPTTVSNLVANNIHSGGGSLIGLTGVGSQLKTITVQTNLWIGGNFGYDSGGGVYTLPAGVVVTVGAPGAPGSIRLGDASWVVGKLRIPNGRLNGTVSSLWVGTGGNSSGDILGSSSCSVAITNTGSLLIGTGRSASAVFGTGTMQAASLTVGGAPSAMLELYGTRLAVTNTTAGAVTVGDSDVARTYVGTSSAGLDLRGSAATVLSLGTGTGLIDIRFTANPIAAVLGTAGDHDGIHYGLKWAGNHTNDLNGFGTKLSIVQTGLSGAFANQATHFYDSAADATYVGFYVKNDPAPTVLTGPETNVAKTSAWLNGTVFSTGAAPPTVRVYWAPTDLYPAYAGWLGTNEWADSAAGAKTWQATGLSPAAAYVYRYYATNVFGESWGEAESFITHGRPVIQTLEESNLTYSSAVLNGNVLSTGGAPTTVRAYWATTDQGANYTGWLGTNDFGAVGEGTINCTASGLAYNTAYVYRYYATNVEGEAWGEAEPFATPFPTPTTLYFNKANDNWNTAANWDPVPQQRVPMFVDTAYIRESRIATIGAGADGVVSNLNIGVTVGGGGNVGTLNVLGTLAVGAGGMTLAYGDGTWGSAKATVEQGTGSVVTVAGSLTVGTYQSNTGDGGLYRVGTNASLAVTGNVSVATGGTCAGAVVQSVGSAVTIRGNLSVGSDGSTYVTRYGTGGVYTVAQSATLRLTGASSALTIGVGSSSSRGTLTYNSTNGTLNIGGSVVLASGNGTWGASSGTLNQGSGSAIAIGGSLTVGSHDSNVGDGGLYRLGTNASLSVTGSVTVATGNSSGGALIQSAGSTLDITGNLYLGNVNATYATSYGTGGVCIVPANATLRLNGAASSVYIAYGQNSRGTLNYNSTVGALTIPGSVVLASGDGTWGPSAGTLDLGPGSAIAIGGDLTLGNYVADTGNGGVCKVGNNASLTVAGITTIATGTRGRGRFNVNGGTAVFGGNLTLGADGRLDLNGGAVHLPRATIVRSGATLACDSGRLVFGIGSVPASGQYDVVNVNAGGVMDLGGELRVDREGAYRPDPTNTYTIIRSNGTLNGVFDNAPVSGGSYRLGPAWAVVTYTPDSVVLSDWRDAPDGVILIVR